MILWVRDRFKNLSFYHYRMIIVTIFVPVILTVVVTYLPVDCLLVRVIIDVGVVLVWALFVVVVVALMVERDMAEANRLVSQQTGPLVEQVHRLEDEHGVLDSRPAAARGRPGKASCGRRLRGWGPNSHLGRFQHD